MSKQSQVTVLIGSSQLLREGIVRILAGSRFRVVLSATHLDDLAEKQLAQHRSALLIIDIDNNDPASTFDQISKFKEMRPEDRVVALADQHRFDILVSCLRAGADAFLTKGTAYHEFIESLDLVSLCHTVLPADALKFFRERTSEFKSEERQIVVDAPGLELNGSSKLSVLSTRERSILQYLVQGESNKVIARSVAITEATVKVHVKTILRKIRVQNRTQAAVWAMSNGLPARGDLERSPVCPRPLQQSEMECGDTNPGNHHYAAPGNLTTGALGTLRPSTAV
jgi:two-component system nitrate/nitrite response regulator NarL